MTILLASQIQTTINTSRSINVNTGIPDDGQTVFELEAVEFDYTLPETELQAETNKMFQGVLWIAEPIGLADLANTNIITMDQNIILNSEAGI